MKPPLRQQAQPRQLSVAVVGCGTAGPAAAVLLSRAGHAVSIFERVENPGPVGAGIVLQPTGQRVLAHLGLAERVIERGQRLDGLRVLRHGSSELLALRYADVDPSLFGVGLHRGVLFSELLAAVRDEPIERFFGTTIASQERRAHQGHFLLSEEQERFGPFDLVVVADGARSALREASGLVTRRDAYPWGALWFVGEDPERAFTGELLQVVDGAHTMIGLLPTGLGVRELGPEQSQVSLFFSLRADRLAAVRRAGLSAFRDTVLSRLPSAESVLDQIGSVDDLLYSGYHDVVMRSWHTRGVVYLGDAAHAMSPQLGQGANLALVDAFLLARALESEGADVVRALPRYERMRTLQLGYYQWVTRLLTPLFQGDSEWLGAMRDALMPSLSKLRPFYSAMIYGMCGTVDGHPWRQISLD